MKKIMIVLSLGIMINIKADVIPTEMLKQQDEVAELFEKYSNSFKDDSETLAENNNFFAELKSKIKNLEEKRGCLKKECQETQNNKPCSEYLLLGVKYRNAIATLMRVEFSADPQLMLAMGSIQFVLDQIFEKMNEKENSPS